MFLAKFSSIFTEHLKLLYQRSTPIQIYALPQARAHLKFILLIFAIHLYLGILVPLYECYPGGNILKHLYLNYNSTLRVFTHQIVPPSFRKTIDYAYLFANSASILGYIALMQINPICDKFRLTVSASSKNRLCIGKYALNRTLSMRLLRFNAKFISFLAVFILVYTLNYNLYFTLQIYINGYYNFNNYTEIFYWFIIFQLQMFYICYGYFSLLANLILSSIYLNALQIEIIQRLAKLNNRLLTAKTVNVPATYRRFLEQNIKLAFICEAIQEYQRFASPFMAIFFTGIIGLATYMFAGVLFTDIPFLEKNVLVVATVVCNLFLFTCTYFAAKVVKGNGQITKQIKVFCDRFAIYASGYYRVLVKMAILQDCLRLKPFAFRLLGAFRITSKKFYFFVCYTSTLFIFILRQNYLYKI